MSKSNGLQFSVVREDPNLELCLFKKFKTKSAALIGSGGCTAFALATQFPQISLLLIDPNENQIRFIQQKASLLERKPRSIVLKCFGVGKKSSLIEQGNFEALFRGFRHFIHEFVSSEREIENILKAGGTARWKNIFRHPYWPVAFDLFFSDSLLKTMFGPAAVRHAPPGSYPDHFRAALQAGLLRRDSKDNYFLWHIFLGRYPTSRSGWPLYLQTLPKRMDLSFFNGKAQNLRSYSSFDFVGLSNIFDWSSDREVKVIATKLKNELKPGAVIAYRQLNHTKNFRNFFSPNFVWLDADAQRFLKKDRSLFYSSIHIGRKIK